jgi:mRNA interferase RelE/StbE
MFKIEFSKDALKALKTMPRATVALILQKLALLAADPFAPNRSVKKLVNRPEYRLRVGSWRVLYLVDGGKLAIEVIRVAPRGGVYR